MALCLSLVGCTSTTPLIKEGDTVIYAQDGSMVLYSPGCTAQEDDTAELGIAAAILAAMMLL